MVTTKLRILRHQYGISLKELERYCHYSYQYLSDLDLGKIRRTPKNENTLNTAMTALIASRREQLTALERAYQTCCGQLLQAMEVEADV